MHTHVGKAREFCRNIDAAHLSNICDQLHTYPQSENTIEYITNEVSQLFSNASKNTFTDSRRNMSNFHNKKPWFGLKCQRARKKYHKAKSRYNAFPNNYNKRMLNKASKIYKQTINYFVKEYNHKKANKLRSLHTTSPK